MTLTSYLITSVTTAIKTHMETLFLYGAAGDDNTPATAADTALANEVFRDSIDEFDSAQSKIITASLRILTTESNGYTIREGGWFDAASAGNLLVRNVLTAITKTSDIQLFLDTQIDIDVSED